MARRALAAADAVRGIYQRGGVRTKHYRAAELRRLLTETGFRVQRMHRVEYAPLP